MKLDTVGIVLMIMQLFACGSAGKAIPKTGHAKQYTCTPCGYDCDNAIDDSPGICKLCNMQLVEKTTVVHNTVEPQNICTYLTMKDTSALVLLDVRSPEEFNGTAPEKFGRLKGALNIPVQQLQQRMAELNRYKDREIMVYCSHSHRSPRASYMLTQAGFKKVTNLNGGMSVVQGLVNGGTCMLKIYIQQ
jgi:rhodanese-related sulfurtransferase